MEARKCAIFALLTGFLNLLLLLHDFYGISRNLEQKIFYRPSHTIKTMHDLEIQFWSVKCTTGTKGYANISRNIPFIPIQTIQALRYNEKTRSK